MQQLIINTVKKLKFISGLTLTILFVASCSQEAVDNTADTNSAMSPPPSTIQSTSPTLADAENRPGDWLAHGRTWSEQRFSPLEEINPETVSDLSLAWYVDLPESRGQEASPIIVDGIMYTTAAWSVVYALNAATGEELWRYDPEVDRSHAVKGCCDAVSRGVAWWEDRVIVGTLDGRLIAIDTETGEEIWSRLTVDLSQAYTITGAPRVAEGLVFIGNGGAEFGVRGYVTAYDIETGEQRWRFYTVPGNPAYGFESDTMEMAAETWQGEWWELGGGGTAWDSMAYDPDLGLLYIGTGNSSPWNPLIRSEGVGDNLFVSSIVALDADTGDYVWHYQTTPGDAWDYTATQHMILADLEIDGALRQVLMQAPKNGFFYVIDRATGEFISGENFVPVTWADGIDYETGRPNVVDSAKYWETGEVSLQSPAFLGGHNWHPMSYSPETGLVYLPAQEMSFPYLADNNFEAKNLAANLGVDTSAARLPDDPAVIEAVKAGTLGHLLAWDPVAQEERWRVQYPGPWNGGVLTTASDLLFQGTAAGFLKAYDVNDGTELWEYPTQAGIVAPPVTYEVDGEQYLTVMAGWGGIFTIITGPLSLSSGQTLDNSRILTFKIGGEATLPDFELSSPDLPDLTNVEIDRELAEQGFAVYDRYCGACHGAGAVGSGVIQDLRYSAFPSDSAAFATVVLDGIFADQGMVGFGSELDAEDAEAVRHYIMTRQEFAASQE
ncbi:MAG: PQQ-dependent dehydrogenase, methanol/ethanol family [Gammaproteobacteria bacterium]|jgi:quinohemoprotein ethanol dehydrogenase|nr:PQQ-dependent dehydrogenase, methanol/ethanol family [Gammaproteobacteria bacterium]